MAPIIKRDRVEVASTDDVPVRKRRGHPKVAKLLEENGEVRAIELTCSCGEKTVVELSYAQNAPAAPPATEPAHAPAPADAAIEPPAGASDLPEETAA